MPQNIEKHIQNSPRVLDHPYRILIIEGSQSGKVNTLLNLMKQQSDNDCNIIDKIYLYVKDPDEVKYFIKKHEKTMQEYKD